MFANVLRPQVLNMIKEVHLPVQKLPKTKKEQNNLHLLTGRTFEILWSARDRVYLLMHESCDYYFSPSSILFCEDVMGNGGLFTLLHNAAPEIMDKRKMIPPQRQRLLFCVSPKSSTRLQSINFLVIFT